MKKSTSIVRLMLILLFAVGVIAPAIAQRGYARDYARGNSRSYSRGYPGYSGGYSNYSRGYNNYGYRSPIIIGRQYSPIYYGPHYSRVPFGSISINFGGNPYYYHGGCFYRPYGGYYRSILPPIGIHIGVLPFGYTPIYVGPQQYYFYNGTYYRQYDDRSYEVIDAPMGAQLSSLPQGAKSVSVNGEKFYELNGTYYKEDRNSKGRQVYTVVGKNGEVENSEEAQALPPSGPREGDKIAQLPSNCKAISLNGQKLYVSPDNTYYKSETDGSFTVVGTATGNAL